MRFYIIAGEASGDLHASNLVKQLKVQRHDLSFRGLGGDMMQRQGVELLKHYRETAFMGFWEVFSNLKKILDYIDLCKKDILEWKPDALILVDYPGFNLRIAEFAKQNGFRIFYYISPQVWAWKSSRVKKIKRDVDRMFVILPFEKDFYKEWNYKVEFVGHPLLDAIADHSFEKKSHIDTDKPVVALLPGSRRQEISKMLPVMLEIISYFPDYQFVIAGIDAIDENFYRQMIGERNCGLVFNQTYALLSQSKAALVTSGTATLEAALFGVPEVVCYKGSALSFWIGRQLVDVKYISLVNLILDQPLVKELIQNKFNAENLKNELKIILNGDKAEALQLGYAELKEKLGGSGASKKTAELILENIERSL